MRWHAPQLQRTAAQRGCGGGGGGSIAGRAPALGQWLQPWQQLIRLDLGQLRLAAGASPQTQQLETERIAEPDPAPTGMAGADQPAAAGQKQEQQQCRGGALSLAGPGGREQEVPKTLPQAAATFCAHPSTLLILAGLGALLWTRAQQPLHPLADAAVASAVVGGWFLQEWAVHALLLHSKFDWVGRRIHVGHHQRPYFHVSIDDPPIVAAFMAAALGLFWLGFRGSELALTAAISYYSMGLLYEWTHYIVHTRYIPRSTLGKRIRMHHMLHHTRHEGYWLAFTVPEVDSLFGTNPEPSTVRMSDMARASLKSARGGDAASRS